MELTLIGLIKAIILHCGRGSSSGDKQLETQQKSSKFKMHQLPLPLSKGQIEKSVTYENVIVKIDLPCFEWPIQRFFSLKWNLEQFNWKARNSEL